MDNVTTIKLVVDRVWTVLGEGKLLHPRTNKEAAKDKIVAAVESALNVPTSTTEVVA